MLIALSVQGSLCSWYYFINDALCVNGDGADGVQDDCVDLFDCLAFAQYDDVAVSVQCAQGVQGSHRVLKVFIVFTVFKVFKMFKGFKVFEVFKVLKAFISFMFIHGLY